MITKFEGFFVTANIIGISIYLYLASWFWAPPGENGLPGGPGDPLIWTGIVFPVLLIFLIFNFVSLIYAISIIRRKKYWMPLLIWIVVSLAWYGAHSFDISRSYNGSLFYGPGNSGNKN
jgi:hypothetical protein